MLSFNRLSFNGLVYMHRHRGLGRVVWLMQPGCWGSGFLALLLQVIRDLKTWLSAEWSEALAWHSMHILLEKKVPSSILNGTIGTTLHQIWNPIRKYKVNMCRIKILVGPIWKHVLLIRNYILHDFSVILSLSTFDVSSWPQLVL